MIINDTERLAKVAIQNSNDATRENYLHVSQEEVKDSVHVARIANPARLGSPLWPHQLEERLKRLNSNFVFEVIDLNPSHKRLSVVDQRGKHAVVVYENSLMPERSIPRLREVEVPDTTWDHSKTRRTDFSTDRTQIRPGWRKVTIPWGEQTRGWRTVLVRLIQAGLITPTQAETEFGSDETPEWRQYTGKGEFTSPF